MAMVQKKKTASSMASKNKANNKNKSKKRRRPEEVFQEQAVDYYQRLLYKCQKVFTRQVKATKKLEYLKLIKRQQPKAKKEAAIQEFKEVTVDSIVQEALRRLGIQSLDPANVFVDEDERNNDDEAEDANKDNDNEINSVEEEEGDGEEEEEEKSVTSSSDESDTDDDRGSTVEKQQSNQWVVEIILSNQHLVKLMEEWSEETRKYRTWFVQGRERLEKPSQSSQKKSKKKKGSKKNSSDDRLSNQQEQEFLTHGQSVFVQLGDAPVMDDDVGEMNPEAEAGSDDDAMFNPHYVPEELKKKKNRPGQRARKAKAQALDAKKLGRKNRLGSESLNWRAKKSADSSSSSYRDASHRGKSSPSSSMQQKAPAAGNPSSSAAATENDELHPSWAARKTQSNAIAKFQGTKITFDNDDD